MVSRFTTCLIAAATALAVASCCGSAAAQAIGFMHVPSTVPQFFGYGYGAGHHAPVVHTPGFQPNRMQRRTWSPGYAAPACYAPIGCNGGACGWQPGREQMSAEPMWTDSAEDAANGPMMAPPQPAPRALAAPPMPTAEPQPAPGPGVNRPLPPPSQLPAPDDRQARRDFFPF